MIMIKLCNWRGNNINQFSLISQDGLALIAARWKKTFGRNQMFTTLLEIILFSCHCMLMIANCCLWSKDLLIKPAADMIKKLKQQEINGQHSKPKILRKHHSLYMQLLIIAK